jgi:hypothetical protein
MFVTDGISWRRYLTIWGRDYDVETPAGNCSNLVNFPLQQQEVVPRASQRAREAA